MPEQLLTPEQVAGLLQVRRSTVLDMARRGDLPGVKIGRAWRFTPGDVEEAVRRLRQPATA